MFKSLCGEDRLRLELLRQAINDFLIYPPDFTIYGYISENGTGDNLFRNAYHWLFNSEIEKKDEVVEDGFLGFYGVCKALCLDPEKLRYYINELYDFGKNRVRPEEYEEFLKKCLTK